VILLLVNNFGPYNVLSALTANNLSDYEEIQQRLDGKIVNIKYIGKNAYQIHTTKKDYILIENNSDEAFLKFRLFESNGEIEVFKNPM
jgi:hypothetical protein